jgi:hypothetical protein
MSEQLVEFEHQLAEVEALLLDAPDDAALLALQSDLLQLMAAALETEEETAAVAVTTAATTTTTTPATTTTPTTTTTAATGASRTDAAEATETTTSTTASATAAALPATALDEQDEHGVPAVDMPLPREQVQQNSVSRWNHVAQRPSSSSAAAATTAKHSLEEDLNNESSTATATTTPTTALPPPKKKSKKVAAEFVPPSHLAYNPNDTDHERKRKKRAVQKLRGEWRARTEEHVANKKQASWQSFAKKKKTKASTGGASMFQTDTTGKVGVVGGRHLTSFEGPKRFKK